MQEKNAPIHEFSEASRTVKFSWDKTFLVLIATLSSTIVLKVAQIQYLEWIYFIQMGVLLIAFHRNRYKIRLFRSLATLGVAYTLFCIVALSLALAALRFDFFFPDMLPAMKHPVIITISRVVELVASVIIMLYVASEFAHDVMKIRFTMCLYFWVGLASAIYSIVCYPFDILGIASLGTYSDLHRMRGFMNEGGPYGLYMLSVLLVGVTIYRQGWQPTRRLVLSMAVIGIAFLKSESKAALAATLFLFLLNGLMAGSVGKRAIVIGSALIFLVISSQFVDLARGIRNYREASATYERVSHLHKEDTSFVAGRVAGAFLVPRMIAAHPWSGIGWGNYATIRNSPEYRGGSAWANVADDPGLGILGTVAELGLPLGAYLLICLIFPYWYLRRLGMPLYLTNLALLQPVVHIFGAQLNMTYPWIITAFALGLAYAITKKESIPSEMPLVQA
ncbi:hypothetical protein BH10ACI4_BH10ACI4_15890 [soil metagenome]